MFNYDYVKINFNKQTFSGSYHFIKLSKTKR